MEDFVEEEIVGTVKLVKDYKAAGANGILPKFIKNVGPRARNWLLIFFPLSKIVSLLPSHGVKPKLLQILKSRKSGNVTKNCRLISLL